MSSHFLFVIARFMRAIQFFAVEKWITRTSRVMTSFAF